MTKLKSPRPDIWRVTLIAPERTVPAMELALDAFVDSLAWSPIDPDADPGHGGPTRIVGHTTRPPRRADLVAATAVAATMVGIEPPDLTLEKLPDTDWLAASLRSFPPIDAGRFQLRGSHIDDPVPAGRIPLIVDAGAAFGSGEHASTKGCLLALDLLLKHRRFTNILDMGCGSGVLALALAKAQPVKALAVDIDEQAARIAGENAKRNGVASRVRAAPSNGYKSRLVHRHAPYDLVFANILARPLTRMAEPLANHLVPGGVAILAGLLNRQERQVLAAHRAQGLAMVGRIRLDGWSTLIVGHRRTWR
ncbi:MAG TPA: 50S ribosomal protein L11 methyltransferase [Magnetospirillaceae bacterium]|jgi:ribosomal protein L11 methyltransferase